MRIGFLLVLCSLALLGAEDPSLAPHRSYGPWHAGVIGGGGYLQHAIWAPSDPRRMYLSSDVGGCWRSDDGGATWRMLHGALPAEATSYSIRGIVVDPRDADRVLIAADSGLWLSADAGEHWRQVLQAAWQGNGAHRAAGRILIIDRADPDTLYAAAIGSGLHISRDGGEHWTRHGPEGLFPIDLYQDRSDPRRLWLSSAGHRTWIHGHEQQLRGGLFLSEDGGLSWARIREQPIAELRQRPGDPGTLVARGFGAERVLRSSDHGRSWTAFEAGLAPPDEDPRRDGSYGALASGPDFLLLGGNGGSFYRLDAGAETWRKIVWRREDIHEGDWWGALSRPTHWHFGSALGWLAVHPEDPQRWAFTDWYAVYLSDSGGRSWALRIDGVEMTVGHVVVQDPADPRRVHLGLADVGYFRSSDGGSTWQQNEHGISNNVKHIAVSTGQPQRLYAVGPQRWEWHANQLFRSDDHGATWTRPAMRGLGAMDDRRCNSVAVHPLRADECYLVLDGRIEPGGGGVWRSTDGGEHWTWIGEGLPAVDHLFRRDIWVAGPEIAVSADGSLVAGSDDTGRVFHRAAGAERWQEIRFDGHRGGTNSVLADPGAPGRFWLCRKEGGLWRSDDGGASWIRALDRDAWAVAVDLQDPRRVAVNGAQGIFLSRDGGATWATLDDALPYRHLRNVLAFAGERLVVGTGGNGAFWCALADAPAAARKLSDAARVAAAPNAAPADLVVNGDMARGGAAPESWAIAGGERAGARLSRDLAVFRSPPAALRLELEDGEPAFVQQRLQRAAQGELRIRGSIRVSGRIQGVIPLQIFDADWQQIAWQELARVRAGQDWQTIDIRATLPPDAAHVMVGVLGEGSGTIWLDDLSVQPTADPIR